VVNASEIKRLSLEPLTKRMMNNQNRCVKDSTVNLVNYYTNQQEQLLP